MDLHTSLKRKMNFRLKLLKTEHLKFLENCRVNNKMHQGLCICNEICLADTTTSKDTLATIQNIYVKVELDVCKALIGHHKKSHKETTQHLERLKRSIQRFMDQDTTKLALLVLHYRGILEKGKHTLTNSLKEKRKNKLTHLTPLSHTTSNTHVSSYSHTHSLPHTTHLEQNSEGQDTTIHQRQRQKCRVEHCHCPSRNPQATPYELQHCIRPWNGCWRPLSPKQRIRRSWLHE